MNGFFISPHLQNLMALAGVSDVYSASNDVFRAFLGIEVSGSQVYRVSNVLGNQIDLDLQKDVVHPDLVDQEVIYASMDGSMVFTDEGWQEVKVGRIFSSQNRVQAGKKGDTETRFLLDKSTYCAHLGSAADFIPAFEASLGTYKAVEERLVLSPMAVSGLSSIWRGFTPVPLRFWIIIMRLSIWLPLARFTLIRSKWVVNGLINSVLAY